ncbi:hypothetical protein B0H16DRAFT_1695762 [Mycena metata]|uniref:Uncharacterized protein n=1 Tax=Mycena metata TaxID=1033252 RepID=A0AAD7I5E7_9AGAR|nr:hypothetical protein B0H16DRAFT_1695762 [Mycena metata]
MPRQDISTCVAITANTLDVLVNTFNISALKAILNTTQSLLKMMETIKQDKSDCAELMEHIHQLLNAIIGVYIKSDTGAELSPSVLNQMAKFTETLHKTYAFVEAHQSGSKVKRFFRQGELNALLKDCKAGLQQELAFFQAGASILNKYQLTAVQRSGQLQMFWLMSMTCSIRLSSDMRRSSILLKQCPPQIQLPHSNSIAMLPAEPKIFYGRDSELADILKLFNQGTPRIAILGAGGMGKTSLARTVLHHEQITSKYPENRFFITGDTASTKIQLAGLIGAHLGMKPGKDLTQAVLRYFNNAPPSLLILDNLETSWEPMEFRTEIEEFLSLLTDIASLALLVTMRGVERPAKVQWTRPFLLPLGPLSQEAARKMFIDIADDRQSMEEVDQVLDLTDNMPLVISLLAHLVDMEDCSTILARWKTEKTSLISEGYDRRSNLELSISLSLSSPRITSMPHSQDLLALLSMLPDGLSDVELRQSKFPIEDIFGCKTALLRSALAYTDGNKRLKVLVPVREYMGRCFPPTDLMIRPLLTHFHELLELYVTVFGKESGAFPIARITSNYTNIQNVLRCGLQLEHPDMTKSIYCTCDFNSFSRLNGHRATTLMEDINHLLPLLHDHRLKAYFITELFQSFTFYPISHPEMLITEALDHLKHLVDPELERKLHSALALYYSHHTHDMPKALEHCQIALDLAQTHGNYSGQCAALVRFSSLEWLGGNYTAARAYAQEVQRLAKLSGELFQEAVGLYYEQNCQKVLGDYKSCILLCTRARTLLGLCGMPHGELNYIVVNSQAEVHQLKSEYTEGHLCLNQILQEALGDQSLYIYGLTLANMAEIEVFMGSPTDEIQRKLDTSKTIFEQQGRKKDIIFPLCCQAALNLREGDMSSFLFCQYLRSSWGNFLYIVSFCLERLGDISCWEGSQHPSLWATVFLAHSLRRTERLGVYKALQYLGDVFCTENNDEVTATSLFTLALEGFTQMDVHRSRAECMIRLGDISQREGDLLKALKLWEAARPLFERSSQTKRVQDVDKRLAWVDQESVK